jgi:hypothetical protein
MNKLKFIYPVLLLSLLLFNCKKANKPVVSGACPNTFTFLKNNALLTYNCQDFFGNPYVATARFDSTSQPGVFKETVKNFLGDGTSNSRYVKGCDGWLLNDLSTSIRDSLKYMEETRKNGDHWVYYDPGYKNLNDYSVYQTNVSITTAAGKFTCDELLYNQEGTINTDTIWWNNSCSIVKYSGLLLNYELASKNY